MSYGRNMHIPRMKLGKIFDMEYWKHSNITMKSSYHTVMEKTL